MNKQEFKQRLSTIKSAMSVTGKKYCSINVLGESVEFVRENKTKSENIPIRELFEFFTNENSINTTIAKSYISGRVQSPAVAILNKLKLTENNNINEKIYSAIQQKPNIKNSIIKPTKSKTKDEVRFFTVLSELLGKEYLLSKSIGKPINSLHIFLSKNYKSYGFSSEINDCYLNILKDLKSNKQFSSDSLSHHIDCAIINHPILKSRIVEFDEEQHFTPARLDTIKHLMKILPNNYFSNFTEICGSKNYLNDHVLKKHRIKNKVESLPKSFIEFIEWLQKSNEKSSGYICSKSGFEFLGGRIAQRAYYDCLRDTAHLSNKNKDFENPLRFAKKTFEDREKMDFSLISNNKIKEIIIEILQNIYKIRIYSA